MEYVWLISPFHFLTIRKHLWTTHPSNLNPQRAYYHRFRLTLLSWKRKRGHLRRDQRPSTGWQWLQPLTAPKEDAALLTCPTLCHLNLPQWRLNCSAQLHLIGHPWVLTVPRLNLKINRRMTTLTWTTRAPPYECLRTEKPWVSTQRLRKTEGWVNWHLGVYILLWFCLLMYDFRFFTAEH